MGVWKPTCLHRQICAGMISISPNGLAEKRGHVFMLPLKLVLRFRADFVSE